MFGETTDAYRRFEEDLLIVEKAFQQFRAQQTTHGGRITCKDKQELRNRLEKLDDELDRYLASEYGVDIPTRMKDEGKKMKDGKASSDSSFISHPSAFQKWKAGHQPFHWFVEFYGIMHAGGFDVIIGNPPYVSYPAKSIGYTVRGYQSVKCGDLFALVTERAVSSLTPYGTCGLIIRLSPASNPSMRSLRKLLLNSGRPMWLSFYSASAQPACLFEGVRDRLSIYILSSPRKSMSKLVKTTKFLKWFAEERQHLFFSHLSWQETPNLDSDYIPKIGLPIESCIYNKIRAQKSIAMLMNSRGRHTLYYHESPVHWQKAWPQPPYYFTEAEGEKRSVSIRELRFDNERWLAAMICMGNSSLLYWFYNAVSDCRHLTMGVYSRLCFDIDQLGDEVLDRLSKLSNSLMIDYDQKKQRYVRFSKQTGKSEFDAFYPAQSKPIIDEIDQVLAQHYVLTDEELDFIINYDIKYRMGRDAGNGGAE